MLTLWGRLSSVNVQKVAWALEELGLAYERIDAGGSYGLNRSPEYLRMNPTGLVPTLVEADGYALWESNAVVRSLAARHGQASLWPENPRLHAEADRWMDWQTTAFTPAMRDAFVQLVRTPPGGPDNAAADASTAATAALAALLDRHLEERAYMVGDAFTVADIALGAATHRWLNLPVERPAGPHLARWYTALMARPAARAALPLPLV